MAPLRAGLVGHRPNSPSTNYRSRSLPGPDIYDVYHDELLSDRGYRAHERIEVDYDKEKQQEFEEVRRLLNAVTP